MGHVLEQRCRAKLSDLFTVRMTVSSVRIAQARMPRYEAPDGGETSISVATAGRAAPEFFQASRVPGAATFVSVIVFVGGQFRQSSLHSGDFLIQLRQIPIPTETDADSPENGGQTGEADNRLTLFRHGQQALADHFDQASLGIVFADPADPCGQQSTFTTAGMPRKMRRPKHSGPSVRATNPRRH